MDPEARRQGCVTALGTFCMRRIRQEGPAIGNACMQKDCTRFLKGMVWGFAIPSFPLAFTSPEKNSRYPRIRGLTMAACRGIAWQRRPPMGRVTPVKTPLCLAFLAVPLAAQIANFDAREQRIVIQDKSGARHSLVSEGLDACSVRVSPDGWAALAKPESVASSVKLAERSSRGRLCA